jgi:hypothetical protein
MAEFLKVPFWHSLRTRIVMLVLVGALPALVGLCVAHYQSYQRTVHEQAEGLRLELDRSLLRLEGVRQSARGLLLAMVKDMLMHGGAPVTCQVFLQNLQPDFSQ